MSGCVGPLADLARGQVGLSRWERRGHRCSTSPNVMTRRATWPGEMMRTRRRTSTRLPSIRVAVTTSNHLRTSTRRRTTSLPAGGTVEGESPRQGGGYEASRRAPRTYPFTPGHAGNSRCSARSCGARAPQPAIFGDGMIATAPRARTSFADPGTTVRPCHASPPCRRSSLSPMARYTRLATTIASRLRSGM